MGIAPRGEPSPQDSADPTRGLARELLRLLHHAGLVPSQLAAMDNVPYDVTALNRFLSGEALPPPYLIDIVTGLCGGDRQGLHQAYERAFRATLRTTDRRSAPRQPPRPGAPAAAALSDVESQPMRQGRIRSRRAIRFRLITAALGFSAVGAVAITATMVAVNGTGVERTPASNRKRAQGTAAVPAPAPVGQPSAGTQAPAEARSGQSPTTEEGAELVKNGRFTSTPRDWWVSEKVRLKVSRQRLRVAVASNSGKNHMDAMVMQNLPPVELGKDYELSFVGAAKTRTMITVTMQREMEMDVPTLFTKETMLTSKMRSFSFRFTAKEDLNPPLICFQVGGHPKGHTMWLDNVSLTEVS